MKDINVVTKQNMLLRDQVETFHPRNLVVVDAHQKLIYKLFTLAQDDSDPERNQTLVMEAIKDYFEAVGYNDISMFLDQIKTYY